MLFHIIFAYLIHNFFVYLMSMLLYQLRSQQKRVISSKVTWRDVGRKSAGNWQHGKALASFRAQKGKKVGAEVVSEKSGKMCSCKKGVALGSVADGEKHSSCPNNSLAGGAGNKHVAPLFFHTIISCWDHPLLGIPIALQTTRHYRMWGWWRPTWG